MGDRCPTCHEPVTIIGTTDLGPTLRRVEKIEGKRDREVTDNERRYREMLEQGITGVENLPHPDAEKYLTHEWLPRARQALSGGDEDG